MPPLYRGGDELNQPNVAKMADARSQRAGFEEQRQRAVEALRLAAAEFRKLEEFTPRRVSLDRAQRVPDVGTGLDY